MLSRQRLFYLSAVEVELQEAFSRETKVMKMIEVKATTKGRRDLDTGYSMLA